MMYMLERTNPDGNVEVPVAIEDLRRLWRAESTPLPIIRAMLERQGLPVIGVDDEGREVVCGTYPAVSTELH